MVVCRRKQTAGAGFRILAVWCCGLLLCLNQAVQAEPGVKAKEQKQPVANKQKPQVNTADSQQPTIKHARLVAWSGADSSLRAYYFKDKQSAESFARTMAAFFVATRFQLVVSEKEVMVLDMDQYKIVMPPNFADQLEIQSDKVILLEGTRLQHQRIEQVMRALNAD